MAPPAPALALPPRPLRSGSLHARRTPQQPPRRRSPPHPSKLPNLRSDLVDARPHLHDRFQTELTRIKFKKDEARNVGSQALNLKLPFGEIDVIENLEQIRRQLGLRMCEVLMISHC